MKNNNFTDSVKAIAAEKTTIKSNEKKTNIKEDTTMNESVIQLGINDVAEAMDHYHKANPNHVPSDQEVREIVKKYYSKKGNVFNLTKIKCNNAAVSSEDQKDQPAITGKQQLFRLTLADFKRPEQKVILMRCLETLMKTPGFEMRRVYPGGTGYYPDGLIPQVAVDLINEAAQKYHMDMRAFTFRNNYYAIFSDLLYQAWLYKDYDWNDLYTVYLRVPGGYMPYMFVDLHPTVDNLEHYFQSFTKDYSDMLKAGDSEERICGRLIYDVVEYCLGKDYYYIFNDDIYQLSRDCQTAFYADAKRIYAELVNAAQK